MNSPVCVPVTVAVPQLVTFNNHILDCKMERQGNQRHLDPGLVTLSDEHSRDDGRQSREPSTHQ